MITNAVYGATTGNDPWWWCGTFNPKSQNTTTSFEEYIKKFFPQQKETKSFENKEIPTTFEEKAEVYANGEIEIQKLIKDAEIEKHQKKGGKWRWCGTFAEPLSKEEIATIKDNYAKTHPAYASVRKECENIKNKHDKTIEKLMKQYDINNIESNENDVIKTNNRNAYKKEIEKQYRKENPDYDLLVKTEKYVSSNRKGEIVFSPKIFDETDIFNTIGINGQIDKIIICR